MTVHRQKRLETFCLKFGRRCSPTPFLVFFIFLVTVVLLRERPNNIQQNADNLFLRSDSVKSWQFVASKVPECNYQNYIFGNSINQTDPCLVAAFKQKYLIPPPPAKEQTYQNYDPTNITDDLSTNIQKLKWVESILIHNPNPSQTVKQGFYIECGANDGEFISPTIRLEKLYNWTGLLIEANPIPFQNLIKKKRNAYAVNAAVCISPHPEPVTFYTNPKETGISGLNRRAYKGVSVETTVQCIPLYTMLAALEVTTVDYLSLDVEGLELAILKTIPFDKVTFKVMTIEHWSVPGGYRALKNFLEPMGYRFVKVLQDRATLDSLFVHETLYDRTMTIKI